jgi:DNA replication protein DnaC
VQAITRHHLRVRCLSTIELVNQLENEQAHGGAGQTANRLVYADVVILDELGCLPFSAMTTALLAGSRISTSAGNDSYRFKNSSTQTPRRSRKSGKPQQP